MRGKICSFCGNAVYLPSKTRIALYKEKLQYSPYMEIYKIKKGLDLRLEGVAARKTEDVLTSDEFALVPDDFPGIVPKVKVREGDQVLVGTPLFVDKATEKVKFVSPVSGTVTAVERGERRKVLSVRVRPDSAQVYKSYDVPDVKGASCEDILQLLLESGIFAFLRQRPYDVVPSPEVQPKAIFVSAFSKMPLAAEFSYVVSGQEEDFRAGIHALSRIAPVHVGICPDQVNTPLLPISNADVSIFDGPNPSGLVGVQINHVNPVNKGETVWTLGAEEVLFLGRLLRTGKPNFSRTIALAGSEVAAPGYLRVKVGQSMESITQGRLKASAHHVRVIDGNPLVGKKSGEFLGAHSTEVCVIPEGDDVNEVLGWIMPRLGELSTHRSYLSAFCKGRVFNPDCRVKGGERHMIMSAEYERVFPMDIYPSFLVKAIITGDIDRQEALGIYEVAPEDFALAEFVCSSKLELQRIVRQGLDILRKENA